MHIRTRRRLSTLEPKYKFQGQSRQEAEMGPEHVECVDSLAGWMRTWLKVAISRK